MKINTVAFFSLLASRGHGFSNDPALDRVKIVDVEGDPNLDKWWKDSYSVGDQCYCDTTFDHGIGEILYDTGFPQLGDNGVMTIREICELLGPGPGQFNNNRPVYNDIQCGNGPINNHDILDEVTCPGRTDVGIEGCGYIGPKWNFAAVLGVDSPTNEPAPMDAPTKSPVVVSPKDILVNAGANGDTSSDRVTLTGNVWKDTSSATVQNTGVYDQEFFQVARSGSGFTYKIDGFESNSVNTLTIGIAELYKPFCAVGKRVIEIRVGGTVFATDVDVFKDAGCEAALLLTDEVPADSNGAYSIEFIGITQNPLVSLIEIKVKDTPTLPTTDVTGSPTMSPIATPTAPPSPGLMPCMEFLVVTEVDAEWMSVSLSRSFTSAIPVCSLEGSDVIVQFQNVGSNSFEIKVEGLANSVTVYCHVFETGSCELADGRELQVNSS